MAEAAPPRLDKGQKPGTGAGSWNFLQLPQTEVMRGASPHRCTKTYSAPGSRCLPPPAPALTPQPGPPQGSVSPAPQEGLGPAAGSLSLAAQPQRRGSRPPFPARDLAPLRPSPQPGPGPRPLGSAPLTRPPRSAAPPPPALAAPPLWPAPRPSLWHRPSLPPGAASAGCRLTP